MNIAVACGGTGGHTFPGLATARLLRERGNNVEVIVAGRSIEASTLKGWDGSVFETGAENCKGKLAKLFSSAKATLPTISHFRETKPDVLLAMGSYASIAPVLAARTLGIPVILHEANTVPGDANGFLSRFASCVATTFPGGEDCFHCKHIERVGLPIRREILTQESRPGYSDNDFVIFVTGGSQGAVALNALVSKAIVDVVKRGKVKNLRVIHQTGNNMGTLEETQGRYKDGGVDAEVSPFLTDMGSCYKVADLVIARAGANTCAEISLFERPSILIPLPSAKNNHQLFNAKYLEDQGAAIVREQGTTDAEMLAETIETFVADTEVAAKMRTKAKGFFASNAELKLAELTEKISAAAK